MAARTLYFKNAIVNGALALQDGGTAPPNGSTQTGFRVAKLAPGNFMLMSVGIETTSFSPTDLLTPAAFSAVSCWRTEQPFTGGFAATPWTFAYRVRAASAAAGQGGRVKCRVWRSASPDGVGAVELSSAVLVGSTVSPIPMSPPSTSTVMWTPGAITFNNEYLWLQCEWEITAASTNANADVLFYINSTTNVVTPDLALVIAPPLHNDIAEAFYAPAPIVRINAVVPQVHIDSDQLATATLAAFNSATTGPHLESDDIPEATVVTHGVVMPEVVEDDDVCYRSEVIAAAIDLIAGVVIDDDSMYGVVIDVGDVQLRPGLRADDDVIHPINLHVGAVMLVPALVKDGDKFLQAKFIGGIQPIKPRLKGSMTYPGYMFGSTSVHRLKGSTGLTI